MEFKTKMSELADLFNKMINEIEKDPRPANIEVAKLSAEMSIAVTLAGILAELKEIRGSLNILTSQGALK